MRGQSLLRLPQWKANDTKVENLDFWEGAKEVGPKTKQKVERTGLPTYKGLVPLAARRRSH